MALTILGSIAVQAQQIEADVVRPVKLLEVPATYRAESFNFVAQINATERAQLTFQVPGQIETLNVRMGQRVEQGQLLATLDATDYQLQVNAQAAKFELASVRLQRAKRLFKDRLISEDENDQAHTAFTAAQTELEQARTDLAYCEVSAPFAGVVSLTHVRAGEVVAAKTSILHLQAVDVLDVTFNLPVHLSHVMRSKEPDVVRQFWVTIDNFGSVRLPARFKEISTQPDPDTNSFVVTFTVDKPRHLSILPGMAAQAFIVYDQQQAEQLTLPAGAIVAQDFNRATIWRLNQETQRINEVQVTVDQQLNVLDGLNEGDQIVIAGAKDLQAQQQVRPWKREGGI